MESTCLWKQFLKTGAVEDYLSYRNTGFADRQDVTGQNGYQRDYVEGQEKINAGFSIGDRDGHQSGANWRI